MAKKAKYQPRGPAPRVKKIERLEDLVLDPKNPNRHTKRGRDLVEASLRNLGAGRGVQVSSDGVVIAGNLTVEEAVSAGLKARVVQTHGDELVVIQRMDMDSESDMAKRMRVVDNQAALISIEWDRDVLAELQREGLLAPLDGTDVMTKFEQDALLGTGTFDYETPQQGKMVDDAVRSQDEIDAMKDAKRKHAERVAERDDSEFSLIVVFAARAEREGFLERYGQDRDAKYVSGADLDASLKARLEGAPAAGRKKR